MLIYWIYFEFIKIRDRMLQIIDLEWLYKLIIILSFKLEEIL